MRKKKNRTKKTTKKANQRPSELGSKAQHDSIYDSYIDKKMNIEAVSRERKKQLRRISKLRGNREMLVYACDIDKQGKGVPLDIRPGDLVLLNDQLATLKGKKMDLVLETLGGMGEVAEDIVKLVRNKFDDLGVIVPGVAKSAGTLIAMAGDEILMEPMSALGPIDAQISSDGKVYSAEAFITALDQIIEQANSENRLSLAYVPILQKISPGEIQHAKNALDFGKELVTEWLIKYKFKNWTVRESSGDAVTDEYKRTRALEIAGRLANHSEWLTHGRSLKIDDLENMGLRVTDYSKEKELADAIRRYYILLRMTFDMNPSICKVIETKNSEMYRHARELMPQVVGAPRSIPINPQTPNIGGFPPGKPADPETAQNIFLETDCNRCGNIIKLQGSFKGPKTNPPPGVIAFPKNNKITCPSCSQSIDLTQIRLMVEKQAKRKIL